VNKSPKIIAVDLTPILPGGENGGAKIFALELLKKLAELAPKTFFVLLTQASSHEELAPLDRKNMSRLMIAGPALASAPKQRLRLLASRLLPRLPRTARNLLGRLGYGINEALKRHGTGALLREIKADLLFCPFTAPTYSEAGVPTVCTIYDLQYKTYPEFFSAEDVAHRDRTFVEACKHASALAAISDYSRDSAIAHGKLEPDRIRTIHLRMAQRISPTQLTRESVLERLKLTPKQYLIYPANFWKHKNHEMLLTAFGVAHHSGLPTNIKLVCTGAPGARQEWLASAVRDMSLAERVLFPGYLPNAELATLISNASGVIFPSLYEGFGLPVIEAMALGVPVACSNTTSLPEVAANAAIMFNPRIPTQISESMISLACDESFRNQLILSGKQRAVEFTDTARMASEYWDLFQYALNNGKCESLLTGTHADGWAGPLLQILVAPAATAQTLEIKFSAPEWLPASSFRILVTCDGKVCGAQLDIQRGSSATWSTPAAKNGGRYEVQISPTFIPAQAGYGEDQRELSLLIHQCGLVFTDGNRTELFPENTPV